MDVNSNKYFVYMLRCRGRGLYTGYTDNLERRLEQHRKGAGSKYVASHKPFELVYTAAFPTQKEAMHEERRIKRLPKGKKDLLITAPPRL